MALCTLESENAGTTCSAKLAASASPVVQKARRVSGELLVFGSRPKTSVEDRSHNSRKQMLQKERSQTGHIIISSTVFTSGTFNEGSPTLTEGLYSSAHPSWRFPHRPAQKAHLLVATRAPQSAFKTEHQQHKAKLW